MARAPKKQVKPPAASTLASRIASRWSGAGEEIALDRLVSELGEEPRYDIVAALKELEKAGAGTFEVGRAGRKARFIWAGKPLKQAGESKPAKGEKPAPKAVTPKAVPVASASRVEPTPRVAAVMGHAEPEQLEHNFHLRPGFVVRVRLPADVTSAEMTRFCQFLQAIPFAG